MEKVIVSATCKHSSIHIPQSEKCTKSKAASKENEEWLKISDSGRSRELR
jgi:hypothetical protein